MLILTLFLLLLALALALVVIGNAFEIPVLSIGGFAFLFILGVIMFGGGVSYKVGENSTTCDWEEVYIYGDNYSGYHFDHYGFDPSPSLNDLNLFHLNRTYSGCVESSVDIYTPFDDSTSHQIGVYLAILAVLGLATVFANLRGGGLNE